VAGLIMGSDGDFLDKDYAEFKPKTEEELERIQTWVTDFGQYFPTLGAVLQYCKPIPPDHQTTIPFFFPNVGLEGRIVIQIDKYGDGEDLIHDRQQERVPESKDSPHGPITLGW
jgi:hypothetical protein